MADKIPILEIEDILIASVQTDLDDVSVKRLQDDLLQAVSKGNPTGVIMDITAVEMVDSFLAKSLNQIAVSVRLLGSQMVIVGIQPALAITLVEMGLDIPGAITTLNLDKGIQKLKELKNNHT